MADTRVDKLLARFKNNPITALIIFAAIAVTGFASLTDAMHRILELFPTQAPLRRCQAGEWSAESGRNGNSLNADRYLLSLNLIGNQVTGRLREISGHGSYDGTNPIVNGTIDGAEIHFVVRSFYYHTGTDQVPYTRSFDGSVFGNEIRFVEANDAGFATYEFTARCVGDSKRTQH